MAEARFTGVRDKDRETLSHMSEKMGSPISRLRSSGRTSPLALNIFFPDGSSSPRLMTPSHCIQVFVGCGVDFVA